MKDATPHQLSFILDEHRYQANFLIDEDGGDALFRRLEQERAALQKGDFKLEAVIDMSDLQVYALPMNAQANANSAEGELDNIVSALSLNGEPETPALADVRAKAVALDALTDALSAEQTQVTLLEFNWENGGGGDNAYGSDFLSTKAPSDAGMAFEDALENWMTEEEHGYDFAFSDGNPPAPTVNASSALADLSGTLLDNSNGDEDSLAHAWGKVLAKVSAELNAPAVAPPAARTRSPRP
jgi:hypothetical protein